MSGTGEQFGPNGAQVQWLLERLGAFSTTEWDGLVAADAANPDYDAIFDRLADALDHADGRAWWLALKDASEHVVLTAAQRAQHENGEGPETIEETHSMDAGWLGEVEPMTVTVLPPREVGPFRRAAWAVLSLALERPFVAADEFARLWSRYEPFLGLLGAERTRAAPAPAELVRAR